MTFKCCYHRVLCVVHNYGVLCHIDDIIRLIIERTCVQSVYAQDNYVLDSQQRFYQMLLRSAFSTHVRSIINWMIAGVQHIFHAWQVIMQHSMTWDFFSSNNNNHSTHLMIAESCNNAVKKLKCVCFAAAWPFDCREPVIQRIVYFCFWSTLI